MSKQLSDEEAIAERKAIDAEIAKEKGLDPETGKPLDEKKVEPAEEKQPAEEQEETPEEKDEDEPAEDNDPEAEVEERKPAEQVSRRVPLSKYQTLKKTSEAAIEAKDATIAQLTKDLDATKGKKAAAAEVKAYAEKHGKTEEEVYELLEIADKLKPAIDPETKKSIDQAAILAKKDKAESDFKGELDALYQDVPEAKDHADKIRAAAFKEGNATKSLYEIYMREIKPSLTAKKKTGESSRGAPGRDTGATVDFAKIAADVKAGKPGALEGLSGEDQDKLFDYMEKNGSRYTRQS